MAPFSRFEEEAAEVLPDKLRLVYPIPKWPGGEDFSPGVPFEFLCDSEPFREQAGFIFRHMSKCFRGGGRLPNRIRRAFPGFPCIGVKKKTQIPLRQMKFRLASAMGHHLQVFWR